MSKELRKPSMVHIQWLVKMYSLWWETYFTFRSHEAIMIILGQKLDAAFWKVGTSKLDLAIIDLSLPFTGSII